MNFSNPRYTTALQKADLVVRICLISICAGFLALLAYCIANRAGYPFELEWLEGDMLLTAVRLLEHKPLYTAPAADYISGIYPPFYYVAAAGVFWLFEPSLPVLRSLSLCGLLGIFGIMYSLIYRETRTGWLSLLGIGIFASFYNFHGAWYDIGRIDSFFFCLVLLGIWLAARAPVSSWCTVGSAVVFCLAVFTKQSSGMYLPFVALFLFLKNRKSAVAFTAIVCVLCGAVFLFLQQTSEGWFAHLTILNPLSFPRHTSAPEEVQNVLRRFPVFLMCAAGGIFFTLLRSKKFTAITIWEITFVPSLIAFLRIRPIVGSYLNDSMYVTVWLSILIPLWVYRFVLAQPAALRNCLSPLILALLAGQLLLQAYSPKKWLPEPGSIEKGKELITELRNAPGPVLVLRHPVYAWMAGKQPAMHFGNFWAYNLVHQNYRAEDLYEKIRGHYFSLIVVDSYEYGFFGEKVARVPEHYVVKRHIEYATSKQFNTVTGIPTKPTEIFKPQD